MKLKGFANFICDKMIGGMALSLAMIAGLSSCGGGDANSVKLEVSPELGDLGEYMTIESKEAVISLSEFTEDGEPCIKIASTIQIKVEKSVASTSRLDLKAIVLDKDKNVLFDNFIEYDVETSSDYDNGDYSTYIKAGSYRAVFDKEGPKKDWDGQASTMWEMVKEKGKYLVLKPSGWDPKFKGYTGSGSNVSEEASDESVDDTVAVATDDDNVTASANGSEDWDKILDEYEAYCTKLASAAKKAMSGDMSAMTEYASLVESAESLEKKLNNAKGELSTAQAARLSKIAAKMAQSMM